MLSPTLDWVGESFNYQLAPPAEFVNTRSDSKTVVCLIPAGAFLCGVCIGPLQVSQLPSTAQKHATSDWVCSSKLAVAKSARVRATWCDVTPPSCQNSCDMGPRQGKHQWETDGRFVQSTSSSLRCGNLPHPKDFPLRFVPDGQVKCNLWSCLTVHLAYWVCVAFVCAQNVPKCHAACTEHKLLISPCSVGVTSPLRSQTKAGPGSSAARCGSYCPPGK